MKASDIKPIATAKETDAQLNDPGITYNEAGVTYNQIGLTYGGVYGSQTVIKIQATAKDVKPR